MKQVNLTLLLVALFSISVFAQDTPDKSFKNAGKKLFSYYSNPAKNADKLQEAKDFIDAAVTGMSEIKENKQPKVLAKASEIYLEIAKNPTLKAKYTDAGEKCMDYAIQSADHSAAKSFNKDEAKKRLEEVGGSIFIMDGNAALQAQEFATAQKAFENVLKCKAKVDELGRTLTFLLLPADQNNIKFYAGYAAFLAKDAKACKVQFESLAADKFDEATVYSFLSKIYQEEGDNEKALQVINDGVTVMSNVKIDEAADNAADEKKRVDQGLKTLLYDKINYFLKTKEMDKLEVELKKAIEQDPENAQLPFTLGQVYEELSAKSFEAGDEEEGTSALNKAVAYYEQTVKVKPDFFDARYQIGALYFNNAVRVYKEQANLGISQEDQKKAKELSKVVNDYYLKAWEAFKTAEKTKANDALLVTAFKQIYLRTNNTDAYTEYKKREDALKADPNAAMEAFTGHPEVLFKK